MLKFSYIGENMINHGFIFLEDGKIKQIDLDNSKYQSHEACAIDILKNSPSLKGIYDEYVQDSIHIQNREHIQISHDPIDFLMQYLGYIKVGLKIDNDRRIISFVCQSEEFNATQGGKSRRGIINTYRTRGYEEESDFATNLYDYVYDLQRENHLFDSLEPSQELGN